MFEVLHSGSIMGDADEVFFDFEDVPPDSYEEGQDGDDSLLAEAPWANPAAPALSDPAAKDLVKKLEKLSAVRFSPVPTERFIVVPHPRDLRRGDRGKDVLALQRALARAGYRKWGVNFTGQFGKGLADDVRQLTKGRTRVYDAQAHKWLARYYDKFGIHLINQVDVRTPQERARARFLTVATVTYNIRHRIGYSQGPARMWIVDHRIRDTGALLKYRYLWEDCSSGFTGLCYMVGIPDPNGFNYNGLGYTGTLAQNGVWVPVGVAPVGTAHFYGSGFPYGHVTGRVSPTRCWSHGQESGPQIYDVHYRTVLTSRVHGGFA